MPGRPAGTGTPKITNRIGKIGGSSEEKQQSKLSAKKLAENLVKFDSLVSSIEDSLKKSYKKNKLSKDQKNIIKEVAETIATNETPDKWNESIASYINNPVKVTDNMTKVDEISQKHSVDRKTAILLLHSEIE
jgi:molecular chaperone DnaK (HSP70)